MPGQPRPGRATVHNCLFQDKNYSEMWSTRGGQHQQGLPHSPANIRHYEVCKKWKQSRETIPCKYNYYKQLNSKKYGGLDIMFHILRIF